MSSLARYCRKIFVGDVHGCFDELMLLLTRLKHDPKRDELYFVGDLAVKGPKSNEVVDFVRTTERTYSVMGNHDYEVLRVARVTNILSPNIKIPTFQFAQYSHDPLLMHRHIECAKSLTPSNLQYMASMPLSLSPHPKIRVVHAGVVPNLDLQKQTPWNLINLRNVIEKPTPKHIDLTINNKPAAARQSFEGTAYHDLGEPWVKLYAGPEHIFFGHDAKRQLQIAAYATGLDTGCCYGGSLTAAIVKCDDYHDDLINELQESQYKIEDWETNINTNRNVSASGVVYRLIQQKAKGVYKNPYRQITSDN